MVTLRDYTPADLDDLLALFYETVHTVNARDYSSVQRSAWAPMAPDRDAWAARLAGNRTLVMQDGDGTIVGFGSMNPARGLLDHLFVHACYQRQGFGTLLCEALELLSLSAVITTYASVTAEPFFAARGYQVVCRRQVERRGVLLVQAVMEKSRNH